MIGDSLFTVGEGKAGSAAGLPYPFGGFTDKIVKFLVFLLFDYNQSLPSQGKGSFLRMLKQFLLTLAFFSLG